MSEDTPLRLMVITASTRNGRFGPTAAEWFVERAGRHGGLEIDPVDLAEVDLPHTLTDDEEPEPEPVVALRERMIAADAFVVVTPEYNHGYPASLKTAIDWYLPEWEAKPVGFVSYGGLAGGLRAVEQLRLIFAAVGATTLKDVVSFHSYWDQFDIDCSWPKEPERASSAAKVLLDQLVWWARALRDARAGYPLT